MRVIALVLYLRLHYIAVGTNNIVLMCRKTQTNKQTNKQFSDKIFYLSFTEELLDL
jgi:hypothetical protein